jgi:hypothetical protein
VRSLLGVGGYVLATVSSTYLLLGKWIVRRQPEPAPPLGFLQAFYSCSRCAGVRPHLVHSSSCRTCQGCGHTTYPGDLQ